VQDIKNYLHEFSDCLHHVHPELQKNPTLVKCLEALEMAWEQCHRYIEDKNVRLALDYMQCDVELVQRMLPHFMCICQDSDPEFFLTLPRIMWLSFLRCPEASSHVEPLLQSLVPHVFIKGGASSTGLLSKESGHVRDLIERFQSNQTLLVDAHIDGTSPCVRTSAWKILVGRAVMGSCKDDSRFCDRLEPSRQKECAASVESLMLELERWSMELQRHRPMDWNELVGMLVQCLNE
jgi:hypothetical protein